MEIFLKILEMLKWPLAIVVIVVFFIIFFRRPIAAFIERLKGIKYRGGELQSDPQPQELAEIKVRSVEKVLQALDSPVLLDTEKAIRDFLAKEGIATAEDKEKVLIRHLAAAQLNLAFSHIDFQIYQGQLKILEFLNSNPSAPKMIAMDVYNRAVTAYPEVLKNYPFEKYLGFLATRNLILEHEETLSITPLGREFLAFLVRTARNAVYRVG